MSADQTTATAQEEMFQEHPDAAALRDILSDGHWLSRRLIAETLRWNVRRVPAAAEKLGKEVVRSHTRGFKLTSLLTPEEIPIATHAANRARAQGRKELGYYLALKRELVKLAIRQIQK